jgi:hypothetical protein
LSKPFISRDLKKASGGGVGGGDDRGLPPGALSAAGTSPWVRQPGKVWLVDPFVMLIVGSLISAKSWPAGR